MQAELYHSEPFLMTSLRKDGTADDAVFFLELLDFASKTVIFFALNDQFYDFGSSRHVEKIVIALSCGTAASLKIFAIKAIRTTLAASL